MEQVALVVGEALVDVVRGRDGSERDHAGGSSANAAVALARLGRPVRFVTAYARDEHGRLLAAHLSDNGVRLVSDPLVLDRTATAVATLAESGAATYEFDIEWRFAPLDLPAEVDPAVVVFGSIGAALDPGARDVARLVEERRQSALTVFDINARPAITGAGPEVVARAAGLAGMAEGVQARDEDFEVLWPGRELGEVAAELMARGAGAVVVTMGEAGLNWFAGSGEGEVAAVRATVADTIGAGDTVTAAIVDALWGLGVVGTAAREGLQGLRAADWTSVLEHAGRAAAITVSRPGGDPPWRHELE